MVISNFYQKPYFTCLSGADPHGFHSFTEIGQIFHNRFIKLQGFIRGDRTGQIILSAWMTQKRKKGDFGKLKSKKNSHWGMLPDPPKSLRVRRSFGKSVSINPRSAPASRFCSCSFIRNLIKQRRFWVMHVNRNWILYPFKMPWWYQIFCSLVSFLSKKRFAEKKWSNTRPKIAKTPHPVEVCGSKNILCA